MSDFENSQQTNSGDLQQQIASLQRQTTTLFVALVIVSFVFAAFVGVQAHRTKKDIEAISPNATRLAQWAANDKPKIDAFVAQLIAYSQTHPDYAEKVINKIGLKAIPNGAAQPASGAVAPTKK